MLASGEAAQVTVAPELVNDTIAAAPTGAQRVRASRIGYSPTDQLVTLSGGQTATVNFAMSTASVTLDQMVVVGYGTQRRSDLTGSVASVTPNVDQTPVLSLEQTLQGSAPGVMVTTGRQRSR